MKLSLAPVTLALGVAFVTGCAGSQDDAGVPKTNLTELQAAEAAHYVVVRADDRTLHVARIGAEKTACADRIARDACEVVDLDLARADLASDDEMLARARIADGSAVVFGKLVSSSGDGSRAGRLVASDVWVRDVAAPALAEQRTGTDAMFVLRDVHEGCETAWLRAEPVGAGRAAHFATLDLAAVGGTLTDGERAALSDGRLLARGAGLGQAFVAMALYARFPGAPRAASRAAAPSGPNELR